MFLLYEQRDRQADITARESFFSETWLKLLIRKERK